MQETFNPAPNGAASSDRARDEGSNGGLGQGTERLVLNGFPDGYEGCTTEGNITRPKTTPDRDPDYMTDQVSIRPRVRWFDVWWDVQIS